MGDMMKVQKSLNVAIFGHSKNAEIVLSFLIGRGVKISFVCFPENCEARKMDKIRVICNEHNISNFGYDPTQILKNLILLKINLIFVASFPHILAKEIVSHPKYGVINMHGSLLPKYRGANPLNWVLVNGETETGVTLCYIDEGIDTGDIIAQRKVPINIKDDAIILRDKIYHAGGQLLEDTWEAFVQDEIVPVRQENSEATYYRKRKPEDGRIKWHSQASEICGLIRALIPPWPGAYCFYGGKKIIIEKAHVEFDNKPHSNPGKILQINKNGLIKITTGYNLLVAEKIRGSLELSEGGSLE